MKEIKAILMGGAIGITLSWLPINVGKSQNDSIQHRELKTQELQNKNDATKGEILDLANKIEPGKVLVKKIVIPKPIYIPKIIYVKVTQIPPKKKELPQYTPISLARLKLARIDTIFFKQPVIKHTPVIKTEIQKPVKHSFFYKLFHKSKT